MFFILVDEQIQILQKGPTAVSSVHFMSVFLISLNEGIFLLLLSNFGHSSKYSNFTKLVDLNLFLKIFLILYLIFRGYISFNQDCISQFI